MASTRTSLARVALGILGAVIAVSAVGWGLGAFRRLPTISHVVLISIDTCRADHLSCYGHRRCTTPNIDALAAEGCRFDNAASPVPLTLPAHSSMLTGTIPPYHGVRDNFGYRLSPGQVTLAETLRQAGFTTGAVVSTYVLDSEFGLDQGFDTYDDEFEEAHFIGHISERKGNEATRLAVRWLEEHRAEQGFLFLHYYDPHIGYEPPEPFATEYADDFYAGEVAFTDQCVGQVVAALKRLNLFDSTLLIVTSDHGEMLGEHGEATHAFFVYQSAVRVPLIFKVPGTREARVVDAPVGIVDIVPTVCGLLGLEPPSGVQGQDLRPLFNASPPDADRYLYCESLTPTKYGANALHSLVGPRWKYIHTTRPELYDLNADPGETRNRLTAQSARAADLEIRLRQVLEAHAEPTAAERIGVTSEVRARLEALGYVGGSAVTESDGLNENGDDPKDVIEFHQTDGRVMALIGQGELEPAAHLCAHMLEDRPSYWKTSLYLGQIAARQGEFAKAVPHLRRALELKTDSIEASHNLGIALAAVGESEAAAAQFRQALTLDPKSADANLKLGQVLRTQGRLDDAAQCFRQALELNPRSAEAHAGWAAALALQGRAEEAAGHLRQAVSIDPQLHNAQYQLGRVLAAQGDLDAAVQHYRAALDSGPDSAAAHYHLAVALRARSDFADAVMHYRRALFIKPDLAEAHNDLGTLLQVAGRAEEAMRHYREAIRLKPALADAHSNLANLLLSSGSSDEAAAHARQAVHLQPTLATGHYNLGRVLLARNDSAEAVRALQEAIRLNPQFVDALGRLAWLLATHPDPAIRRPQEAVELATRAARLTRQRDPRVLDALAAAYAGTGHYDLAIRTAESAVSLASAAGRQEMAGRINRRLERYRRGEPHVQPIGPPSPPQQ